MWALLKTFALPITIFVLRNGYSYYQRVRETYFVRQPQIRPVPPRVSRALNLLFITSVAFLIYTLPYLSPPNIFTATSSRLQTPTSVLFTRLSALPAHRQAPFIPTLDKLKEKLTSQSARLIYFAYGPDAVAACPFCTPKQPTTYMLYNLPALATPHLLHLVIIGLATSRSQSGPQAARWRPYALIAALALLLYDVYASATYPLHDNSAPQRANVNAIDFFFWRARTMRGIAICVADLLLAAAMYLSSTNRFFLRPATVAEKAARLAAVLEGANFRLWGSGNVRNAVARDAEARDAVAKYFELEHAVYEEAPVVAAVRSAVGKADMRALQTAAGTRAGDIVRSLDALGGNGAATAAAAAAAGGETGTEHDNDIAD